MSGARDSQRTKVYRWERASIPGWPVGRYHNEMSLDECAALVAKVWAAYRPETHRLPQVTPGHLARQATGARDRINLPRWARQPLIVLHETTHSLQPLIRWDVRDGTHLPDGGTLETVAWHGPEFMRLYIELLVRYYAPARGMRGELLRSARAARIRVGSLQDCLKPARRMVR